MRDFGLEIPMIQWVVISYVLTHASLMLVFGRLGEQALSQVTDRRPHARVIARLDRGDPRLDPAAGLRARARHRLIGATALLLAVGWLSPTAGPAAQQLGYGFIGGAALVALLVSGGRSTPPLPIPLARSDSP